MTRFAFYSVEGSSLAWQRRLYDEGHEILVYIDKDHGKGQQKVGNGLVPKTANFDEWRRFGDAGSRTVWFFDFSSCGGIAEMLRSSGRRVVGAGRFCDRIEDDRAFGEKIAVDCGLLCPPSKTFPTISAAISWLKTNPQQAHGDGGWAWKPNKDLGADASMVLSDTQAMVTWLEQTARVRYGDNNACLLQEKIAGTALSTARWWNGHAFVGPYEATLEEKKLMNDDKGPSTGCSLNLVWFYAQKEPRIARELKWDAITTAFFKAGAPPGLYDVNAVVNAKGAYFLEWTPRLGYDSELTSQRGITNLGEFLSRLAYGHDGVDELFDLDRVYGGVRLTVPPYPTGEKLIVPEKNPAMGVTVAGIDGLWQHKLVAAGLARNSGGFECVDPYGFIGVAVGAGSSLGETFGPVYDYLDEKLDVPNLQYRTDAEAIVRKDLEKMREDGWGSTPVLEDE